MTLKRILESWKYPSILLVGIGIANVGEWIYLIALNLIVLDKTGSPLAVSVLYILRPLAALFTNVWAGSLIDRINKRNLMVSLDLIRAMLIFILPLYSSIWFIYFIVLFINMASSMFRPTSTAYKTKLIPSEQRKQFNSLYSLVTSGGFLIGPAIAGMLFLIGTPTLAIYVNSIAYLLSSIITLFMPNLEKDMTWESPTQKISLELLKEDWRIVLNFSRHNVYIMIIYLLFSCVMVVMTSGIDSLEAAFAKEVLRLTDSDYSFLVSIAGAGIAVGALVNTLFVKKISIPFLIGFGAIFVSVGYMVYACSNSFFIAAVGFFIVAFFIAFANTGYLTFYQNNIPVELMGRIGSVYGFIEAILVIVATILFGTAAQFISIQPVVIAGTIVMLILAITLCMTCLQRSKADFYQISIQDENVKSY
ncbi:MFS transporter [Paenibacillus sediminis]|uniref:MFS family permease n=1 Tax=Paenibacillus sediminis TaxID=664909 RepID=A0ABS4H093_9BACL|nr:MFS transporter [Paenibacillus sediminis]MBP1935948.1 MFS family permease [Paenibacillus sediminis]